MAQDNIWNSIEEDDILSDEVDQKDLQVIKIKARNKRIMDKAAGIVTPEEPREQMPVNKDNLKQKAPQRSNNWNPYE